jgi:hypothetical protein
MSTTPPYNQIGRWLAKQDNKYTKMSNDLKVTIGYFTMVWSIFECHYIGGKGRRKDLVKFLDQADFSSLKMDTLEENYQYFRNRYVNAGSLNDGAGSLYGIDTFTRDFLRVNLVPREVPDEAKVKSILLISYRFRCNLFHGGKWEMNIDAQLENLMRSILSIMDIVDQMQKKAS